MTRGADPLFACPRCDAPQGGAGPLVCPRCGASHPVIDGVPCLMHDAAAACGRFAARFADAASECAAQLVALDRELVGAPMATTRARLAAFAEGVRTSAATLATLGERIPKARDPDVVVPSVAGHASLFDHYEYAFRDWGWGAEGDAQNGRALARVIEAAGDLGRAPRVLVLGAGAGRLAYDLHVELGAQATVALDIQPLLVLLARRMSLGDEVELAEFTTNYLAVPQAVVSRALRAPAPAPPGLVFAFADATRPPVPSGTFDLVVTSWFLDELHADVRDVLPAIGDALVDGGRWVFHGPLLHPRGKPLARCVVADELVELAMAAGLEPVARRRDVMPYLRGPEGNGRSEPVLTLAARKRAASARPCPPWLRAVTLPIPRSMASVPTRDPLAVAVATFVDGRRSALGIAELLARHAGVAPRVALDTALSGLHELARASTPA